VVPAPRFWIPDGFFGGAGDALDLTASVMGTPPGEHLFVSARRDDCCRGRALVARALLGGVRRRRVRAPGAGAISGRRNPAQQMSDSRYSSSRASKPSGVLYWAPIRLGTPGHGRCARRILVNRGGQARQRRSAARSQRCRSFAIETRSRRAGKRDSQSQRRLRSDAGRQRATSACHEVVEIRLRSRRDVNGSALRRVVRRDHL
jgi:hypothetical protein